MDDTPQNERANDPLSPEAHEVPQTETSGQMGEERTSDVAPYQKYLLFAVLALLSLTVIVVVVGVMFSGGGIQKNEGATPGNEAGQVQPSSALGYSEDQQKIIDALKTGKFETCDTLEERLRTTCKNQIVLQKAEALPFDTSICEKADGDLLLRSECEQQAFSHNIHTLTDPEQCDVIQTESVRSECRSEVLQQQAITQDSKAFCENFKEESEQISCADTYTFENEFLESTSDFECSTFESEQYVADCHRFQELYAQGGAITLQSCQAAEIQSTRFLLLCRSTWRLDN